MVNENRGQPASSAEGFSLIELLIVLALIGIMTAIAVPQMIAQRRVLRSNAVIREIGAQMRYARQLAIAQGQAVTFQYDDLTKEIKIIDHNNDSTDFKSGTAVLVAADYPSTALPAKVVSTVSLSQGGLVGAEMSYGIPATVTGLPSKLGDGVSMTPTPLDENKKFNVTFQADGSVIDKTSVPAGPPAGVPVSLGIPMDQAIFIFNSKAEKNTAAAISVLGASGRIKVWRYNDGANTYKE